MRWYQNAGIRTHLRRSFALLLAWLGLALPAVAQSQFEQDLQRRLTETTILIADYPRLAGLTLDEKRKLVEFTAGNLLFVLAHEAGHAVISEMGIPVIGRNEDGADSFATVMALQIGADYADSVLSQAATGWFYSERRNRQDRVKMNFYDEHGIDLQRAYNIVCLMVGADPARFGDLAKETGMPEERQASCEADYSNAEWSWNEVLEPHRRRPNQPKTDIWTVYGPAENELAVFREAISKMQILETVAAMLSEKYVWRRPITLELQTCGIPSASWELKVQKVIICYEIVQEFAQLYRSYRKIDAFAIVNEEQLQAASTFHSAAE